MASFQCRVSSSEQPVPSVFKDASLSYISDYIILTASHADFGEIYSDCLCHTGSWSPAPPCKPFLTSSPCLRPVHSFRCRLNQICYYRCSKIATLPFA